MTHSETRKILFVCAQNKIRSYTAEKMFCTSWHFQVRSRGVAKNARIKITEGDIGWADMIFVMEKNHKDIIMKHFRNKLIGKKIICLFIEDIYEAMEASLVVELRKKLAPHITLPDS